MKRNYISIRMIGITACLFLILSAGIQATTVFAANGSGPPFVPGQVVVVGGPDGLPLGYDVIKYLPNADLTVVKVELGKEWGQIQSLRAKGFRANLNLVAKASVDINDPFYSYQWHFPMIQSENAWDISSGFRVTVAVLDTGLAMGGPDGIGCVVSGYDVVNGDNDPDDGDGHGTHVSGTISQATINGTGVAGLAYGACIMPVKVLDDNGIGTFADIAEGIYYAVNNDAKVINMSLGTNAIFNLRNDPIMDTALNYAYSGGVTVVCASGNDGWLKNVSYPAIYPTTIAVGAVDYSGTVTSYSNKGDGLDLVAPGGDTTKDLNGDGYVDGVLQETRINGNWGYWFFQGTSMASPHVAAVAAMLYSNDPNNTTPDGVREALTFTALDIGVAGFDDISGYGLVQAYDALRYGECMDSDIDHWTTCDGDCDDSEAAINPGATEICNGIDDNCDGQVDEGGICPPVTCGNDLCEAGEDCNSCPNDCKRGSIGGTDCNDCFKQQCDGICHPNKDGPNCPDCISSWCCGDGVCEGEENIDICSIDCGCSDNADCNDNQSCTTDVCNAGICENSWPDCGVNDGCCDPECSPGSDPDCQDLDCSACFKQTCDGICHPTKDLPGCPDCQ